MCFHIYHPGLRELLDLKVFVRTDADIRLMRRKMLGYNTKG